MANTRSARKITRKIQKRTEVNNSRRSRIRTYIKRVEQAIAQGDQGVALNAFKEAQSEILRGVTKGVMHLSTASRKISRLYKSVNNISKDAA
jgi:small subunit ribosomal protein S20